MSENTPSDEQRHFSRIPFDAQVRMIANENSWKSELYDISLKGALVKKPEGWSASTGDTYKLEITLGADVEIDMEGSVVHIEKNQVGFRCDHIDLDSITHLRRIIELNMGDAELLNRELSALSSPED